MKLDRSWPASFPCFKRSRQEKDVQRTVRAYERENLAAAEIVLACPDRYGGEESALVIWARMVKEKSEGQ